MKFTQEDIVCIFVVSLFVLVACAVSAIDYDDENRQQQLYCDMYKIFLESNGEYGWPDYNSNAAEICE
tara:strand:- start:65 stop:268 length:204 start_codon:yes stop_codon:yes gene_type:complete